MILNTVVNTGAVNCNTGLWNGLFWSNLSKKVGTVIWQQTDSCIEKRECEAIWVPLSYLLILILSFQIPTEEDEFCCKP